MSTAPAPARKGEWLESWDPENEQTWDKSLAWRTLWVTTFCLTLAFVAWFLPSAIIPRTQDRRVGKKCRRSWTPNK